MTAFAELAAATSFSFLRGASEPADMVATAIMLGHAGIGIADRNTVAGVVRAHAALRQIRSQLKDAGEPDLDFQLAVGARLVFADDTPDVIAYPANRHGWGRLCRLLTTGNRRAEKGDCILHFADLVEYAQDLLLIVMPPDHGPVPRLAEISALLPKHTWLGVQMSRRGPDRRRAQALHVLCEGLDIPAIAVNAPLYATPAQRRLHDVLTCIHQKTILSEAGKRLEANAERHLKSPAEMARLFSKHPRAIAETTRFLKKISFSLNDLRYEYPHEPVPAGYTPQAWLETLSFERAAIFWPAGIPPKVLKSLHTELAMIAKLNYAAYFLTVHDLVEFANKEGILCQGRGSAANSAVCYVLGITAVNPDKHTLLFSRFISEERGEPPDIDVDFEHERREEVMQYVYRRYGRDRAGIAATVIHYRPRSAVREVGKVLGLSEDVTTRLTGTVWGSSANAMEKKRFSESGFDPETLEMQRLADLVNQIMSFPRHLSQHVGGFVLTNDRLDETVPIHNAAMVDRTFIEWDKDDIDELGLMKVDVLALGMLTCIRKIFVLIQTHIGKQYQINNVPEDVGAVYDMLGRGDSVGVFQVESRAQMNMLPRLKPRTLYDLCIQVAIVRPGPIQGDMVHPYLRRRQGLETITFPSPGPGHDPNELHDVLGATHGVPLFQEQAMNLAITAAAFTPVEANQLRRAMATFRNVGTMHNFEEKMVGGMVRRGYQQEFAERCYKQNQSFGSYGFPESHALAFAKLVWVSSYLKCLYPAAFAAGLLNSQPMGFYAPSQIVRDASEHGVVINPIDINHSDWDNSLEGGALRLGFRQITGFTTAWAQALANARPFTSIEDLAQRTALPERALRLLADADACSSLGLDRRNAAWEALRTRSDVLPLFAAAKARELGAEPQVDLPLLTPGEEVVVDFQMLRLSLKNHPMALVRPQFSGERIHSCAATSASPNGRRVHTAGIVLIRQRPGNGNAIFVTIEDETGVTNVVIWASLFETYRREIMASRLMLVEGEVQRSPEGVIHLMATRIADRSAALDLLSEDQGPPIQATRGDEFIHPDQLPSHPGAMARHPRDVRILPKSRDFH
ncbi:error-prone DNA polymerase [Polymorphobacter glacialis]|uniref:Error-prone DNA polymerase n=1 Tax=Sandarakinorhabdus glacialis TaxID=1614636 RepID=A0A916ZRX8_9SPHN|nr:error-prone DNA polymerase [Polymorphobacter glacialis]GGE09394.1 error-prone DNA polymerase [Polymorphobacter glacialis]